MKYLYPLNAIHIDGDVILLYTKEEVDKFIRKHGSWNDNHIDHIFNWSTRSNEEIHHNWIVRDDRGRIVDVEDFVERYTWKYYNERRKKIRAIAEKGLPIPGTGTSKAGYKQNHPAKKNSGYHHFAKNASKYSYDIKTYDLKGKTRGSKWRHRDPWW